MKYTKLTGLCGAFMVFAWLLFACTSSPSNEPGVETGSDSGTRDTVLTANAPPPSPVIVPHIGPSALYPNPTLTPGVVFVDVTKEQVCVVGYTKTVRNVSAATKDAVFKEYGLFDVTHGSYEVDHFISLELGGTNDIANLWPEPYKTANISPMIGARDKDKVENYLHGQVCSGAMTLVQAQTAIRQDWYKVYQDKGGKF